MKKTAHWIAPEGVKNRRNCHFTAEKEFEVPDVPDSLFLDIACESYYLLKINDVVVGRGPARGSNFNYYYDTRQITQYLHKGSNRIFVEVHCMNVPTGRNVPIEPALWVRCGDLVATDSSWTCRFADREWPQDAPFYNMQQGLCEWRDLRFTDQAQTLPTVIIPETSDIFKRKLIANDNPVAVENSCLAMECLYPAFVPQADLEDKQIAVLGDKEPHFPVPHGTWAALDKLTLGGEHRIEVPEAPDNGGFTVIFNFGKLVSGRFELELTAPEGAVADIAHEEELFQDERLRSDHTATNKTYNLSDRYILRCGRQTIGNCMFDRGFRMIRITIRNYGQGKVILHRISGIDRRYPLSMRSRFFCSDYQLNRLWEIAFETISGCTTDVITDCPWRERLFFTNDFVVENRSALQLTCDIPMIRHAFRMIFAETDENGIFPCVVPSHRSMMIHHGFPARWGWILSCNLTLPLSVLEYYLYTGDTESIQEWYPVMRKMLATFRGWIKDGVINCCDQYGGKTMFFDWSFEMNGKRIPAEGSALTNYMYIIALRAMEKLKGPAGAAQDEYEPEIAAIHEATMKNFYIPEDKVLIDAEGGIMDKENLALLGIHIDEGADFRSSRLVHALALLAGADEIIPDKGALEKVLVDDSFFPPELFYGSFIQLAMKKHRLHKEELAYIRQYWGPVLDSGTPTLWENGVYSAGKAGFGGSASLCHGFSSSPVDFLQTVILGITPVEAGFVKFEFNPDPCGLTFAHGCVATPHGTIRVNWKVVDNKIEAELFVPENTCAVTPIGELQSGRHKICF